MSAKDLVQLCLQGRHLGLFPKGAARGLGGSVLPQGGRVTVHLSQHKCFPRVNIPDLPQGQGSASRLSRRPERVARNTQYLDPVHGVMNDGGLRLLQKKEAQRKERVQ